MRDYEKLKNQTGAIQNIALTIAIIVGGIWTLYIFNILGQKEKAKYDLIGKPSLNISIETTRTKPTNKKAYTGLIIDVNIENVGTQYIDLQVDKGLCVSKLETVNDSLIRSTQNINLKTISQYLEMNELKYQMLQGIQPNSKKTISYYCELDNSGIYYIRFKAQATNEMELEKLYGYNLKDESISNTNNRIHKNWAASKYIEIQ